VLEIPIKEIRNITLVGKICFWLVVIWIVFGVFKVFILNKPEMDIPSLDINSDYCFLLIFDSNVNRNGVYEVDCGSVAGIKRK